MPVLSARGLSKAYGPQTLLSDVSVTIVRGRAGQTTRRERNRQVDIAAHSRREGARGRPSTDVETRASFSSSKSPRSTARRRRARSSRKGSPMENGDVAARRAHASTPAGRSPRREQSLVGERIQETARRMDVRTRQRHAQEAGRDRRRSPSRHDERWRAASRRARARPRGPPDARGPRRAHQPRRRHDRLAPRPPEDRAHRRAPPRDARQVRARHRLRTNPRARSRGAPFLPWRILRLPRGEGRAVRPRGACRAKPHELREARAGVADAAAQGEEHEAESAHRAGRDGHRFDPHEGARRRQPLGPRAGAAPPISGGASSTSKASASPSPGARSSRTSKSTSSPAIGSASSARTARARPRSCAS